MTMDESTLEKLEGMFHGQGVWHDALDQSMTYTVHQMTRATIDGFEIAFKHDFADGTVVDGRFQMTWVTAHLFRVSVGGSPLGHGYVFDGFCHYHLETRTAFVEASYRVDGDIVEVFGSSTKNAEGNYIAWREVLRRQS
jgi:hypothetical protein